MSRKILIAGRPGVGKTTLIKNVLKRLPTPAAGFFTEEIRTGGERLGFKVRDIATGREGMIAHVDYPGPLRVGRYGVALADFEEVGVKALEDALERDAIIVIDELGKMEILSKKFQDVVLRIFDSNKSVIATIGAKPHPLTDAIRKRKDVAIFQVTAKNRDGLPEEIVLAMRQ